MERSPSPGVVVAWIAAGTAVAVAGVAAVLGLERPWSIAQFLAILLHPFASLYLLLRFPGDRRFLAPLLAILGGVLGSLLFARVTALQNSTGLLSIVLQILVGIPAFAAGLLLLGWGTLRNPAFPWRLLSRAALALSVSSGLLLFAVPLAAGRREREIAAAKEWVEALAREVRKERLDRGVLPVRIDDLVPRVGPPPRAAAFHDLPTYEVASDSFSLEFTLPDFMGVEGWSLDGGTGTWDHWVD
ncbi:MAG: hypothetical protein HUU06_08460 [Planctomycetaceae bacterium]|nr:hypothetical protein [Planctomycetaceae bacterium]